MTTEKYNSIIKEFPYFSNLSKNNLETLFEFMQLGGALTFYDDCGQLAIIDETEYTDYFDRLTRENEEYFDCCNLDDLLERLTKHSLVQAGLNPKDADALYKMDFDADLWD